MNTNANQPAVTQTLREHGVVPVLTLENVEDALKMATVLKEAGLLTAEITFRTKAAADCIRAMHEAQPDLCLGAGTILNVEDLHQAFAAGAVFAVAPGFNPNVVREAVEHQYPFFPGIATPSELEQAMNEGCRVFKFFPAEAAGGTKMLASIVAPYRHLGIEFIPTGGISPGNLAGYLSIPDVIAVGGTWLGRAEDISAGRWPEIATAVRKAVCAVLAVRSSS